MASVFKFLGNTVVCNSTPSNFSSAKLVRVNNTGTAVANVCVRDEANNILSYAWMGGNTELIIEKSPTDTLESNNNTTVVGVPIAYRN